MANEMPKLSDIFILGEEVSEARAVQEWVVPTDTANKTIPSLYPISEIQIINNTITPTGFMHAINYIGSDGQLATISTSESRDGALLRLRIADNGKPVTIVNGSGTLGAISTNTGENVVLDNIKDIVEFQLEGSVWRQFGGIQKQADALQDNPTKPDYIKNIDVLTNVDLSNLSEVGENKFANTDLSNLSDVGKGRFVPAGAVIASGSLTTPEGYLLCNGASVSRSLYPELFEAIGTTFGSVDSSTFSLPLLTDGRYIRGAPSAGAKLDAGLPDITGTIAFHFGNVTSASGAFAKSGSAVIATGTPAGPFSNTVTIDATRSSSLYGKYSTVVPTSLQLKYFIKY